MTDSLQSVGIPAGIATGNDYLTLLRACHEGCYALPAINVTSSSTANAVLEAAAHNKSDIIIQLSYSGARFYGGRGLKNDHKAAVYGALSLAQHIHMVAKEYGIAVILHTDHANRPLIPWLNDLIDFSATQYANTGRPLFSSHMLDLSTEPLEDNIKECAIILKRLTPLGVGLEIELGLTGGEEDGIGQEYNENTTDNAHLYTQPEDVLKAWQELSPLGTVSIAASFGNVHGVYKTKINLNPEILKASQELVQHFSHTGPKPLHLVFHGGSGSELEKIEQAISYGVFKMNIDTDTQFAYAQGVGHYIKDNQEAFEYQVSPVTGQPLKKLYDPRRWVRAGELSLIERLHQSFITLGSRGKTIAFR
ncbi:class II fructose-bisphosphate aldolase [Aristophania vespae]|uniref:Fructose-bisphosphate aldolase n=1 Tax=Aristophania vespae TaxID=2697033 RepID=A0A6P1NBT9_9PROT|nr:class II fructose-bisphosphate aldolase [Aristophania vespae]QHI94983.1 class II fructose-bisphosphate aldolase [Aristophania vespae]